MNAVDVALRRNSAFRPINTPVIIMTDIPRASPTGHKQAQGKATDGRAKLTDRPTDQTTVDRPPTGRPTARARIRITYLPNMATSSMRKVAGKFDVGGTRWQGQPGSTYYFRWLRATPLREHPTAPTPVG